MPRNVNKSWMKELFCDVMKTKKARWKTSATGRQEISMLHKFLRATGWASLEFEGLASFRNYVAREVTENQIVETCMGFLDKFCAEQASRRRYQHIFRLFFVAYLEKVSKERFHAIVDATIPEYETLADLDERLSASTCHDGNTGDNRKYFTQEEVDRLLQAQHRIIDRLVVAMLETTGLRRRGLVNVRISDVATRDVSTGRWTAGEFGKTLTKGAKWHDFKLFPLARGCIDAWLNSSPKFGGRPPSPSLFLLPSARTDDGQMSVSMLTRLFKACCLRAGLENSTRCHLHAMRHYHMQRLKELGNEDSAIQVQAGHEDIRTMHTYTDRSVAMVSRTLRTPVTWGHSVEAEETSPPSAATPHPQKKKQRSVTLIGLAEVLKESRIRLDPPKSPATLLI